MNYNFNTSKETLSRDTDLKYMLQILRSGVAKIAKSPMLIASYISATVVFWMFANAYTMRSDYPIGRLICSLAFAAIFVFASTLFVYFVGSVKNGKKIVADFQRIGMTNSAGETPLPIAVSAESGSHIKHITFSSKGFPVCEWEKLREKVQTALNITITKIEQGSNQREVVISYIDGSETLPDVVVWNNREVSGKDFVMKLGVSLVGDVGIDLTKTPHWLIAGATGLGKTKLLQLIVYQAAAKKARVIIADVKGGIDFSHCGKFELITTETDLNTVLDELVEEIDSRKQVLLRSGCSNISEFNKQSRNRMQRIILVVDEASLLLDKRGLSKEAKAYADELIGKLNSLGRLARFVGIHLVVSTQRPDVDSVPGSLKANLDGRICSHTSDVTSSTVVLDNGNAAKLPAVPGRFILQNGGMEEIEFQAFLL